MFPKTGKFFPTHGGGAGPQAKYTDIVSAALRSQLGDTHQAIKTAIKWTRANERTVKHWLRGDTGPNGDHLLCLLRQSPELLYGILIASGWGDLARSIVETQWFRPENRGDTVRRYRTAYRDTHSAYTPSKHNDPKNDPDRVPDDDPDLVTDRRRSLYLPEGIEVIGLNDRQQWFLCELVKGHRVRHRDICEEFNVAEKTSKRDVAGLKRKRLVTFVGSCRAGHYEIGTHSG
jgi:hypothetical protein